MDKKRLQESMNYIRMLRLRQDLRRLKRKKQKNLRQEYIFAMKQNLRSVLNNIDIKEPDGSITRLEDIDPTKKV